MIIQKNNVSDQELLTAYFAGDKDAIDNLIERHKSKIYNYIFLLVKNHHVADDVFQETFIKVMKSLCEGRYADNGKFLSWVLRIAHNQVIDYFRQNKKGQTITSDDAGYDLLNSRRLVENSIEDKLVSDQMKDELKNLVDALPDEQRDVVLKRHYMGWSFKEIADHEGISINTALGRMRYALINMRKLIKEKNLSISAEYLIS